MENKEDKDIDMANYFKPLKQFNRKDVFMIIFIIVCIALAIFAGTVYRIGISDCKSYYEPIVEKMQTNYGQTYDIYPNMQNGSVSPFISTRLTLK